MLGIGNLDPKTQVGRVKGPRLAATMADTRVSVCVRVSLLSYRNRTTNVVNAAHRSRPTHITANTVAGTYRSAVVPLSLAVAIAVDIAVEVHSRQNTVRRTQVCRAHGSSLSVGQQLRRDSQSKVW